MWIGFGFIVTPEGQGNNDESVSWNCSGHSPRVALPQPPPSRLMKRKLTRRWAAAFVPLGAALVLLKLGLFANHIWGSEGSGVSPLLLGKLPLVLGGDMLGAALGALLVTATAWPLARHHRWADFAGALLVFGLLFLAVVSTFTVVFAGGLINKSVLDSMQIILGSGGESTNAGFWASIESYFTLPFLSALTVIPAAGAGSFIWLHRRSARQFAWLQHRWVRAALLAETAITILILPFFMSGEIGGIRVYTVGLEKSPFVELGWSYLRPVLRSLTRHDIDLGDEFRLPLEAQHEGEGEPPLSGARPGPSNVLLIMMESVGQAYLEVEENPMPYLRSFGQRPGTVRFMQHYSTWSLTTKALFSLLCSELPYPNYKPISLVNPAIPATSLPEVLKAAGYRTAYITSQDFAYDRQSRFLKHRRFDLFLDMHNLKGHEEAWHGKWGIDDAVTVQAVLEESRKPGPFFILFGMVSGHHPFVASRAQEDAPEETRVARYFGALRYADSQLKALLDGLAEDGVLQDTLVVVVSDHGEGHGNHEGRNTYEEVVKVPAVIIGPQTADLQLRVERVTSHLDIAPTILGLLGLEIPCTMKGRNLVTTGEARVAFFGGRPPKFQLGLADGTWKYILEDGHVEMLYNRIDDPEAEDNLVGEHPELVQAFKQRIQFWEQHSENLIENYGACLQNSDCR